MTYTPGPRQAVAEPAKLLRTVERYDHHGRNVAVRSDLKGQHRDHCLCYSCAYFCPGSPDHCKIAAAIFANCQAFGVVTPVWECPEFEVLE